MAKSEAVIESGFAPVFETALAHEDHNAVAQGSFKVEEVRDYGFVVLRLNPETEGVPAAVERLGLSLPATLQSTGSLDSRLVKWISPDEYLVSLPLAEKEAFMQEAQAALDGIFSAVVDNSGGYSLLKVSGEQRYEVLRKLCFYDLERELPIGKVVSTLAAKAPAVFYRVEADSFMWLVRWSFATHVWRSLLKASAEFY